MKKKILHFLTFLFAVQILAACASAEPALPTSTPIPPTETAAPPTNTATLLPTDTPTFTPLPPTDTPTLEPTSTSTLAITDTPTLTATFTPPPITARPFIPLPAASSDTIKIYFIQSIPGSGECNDRIFAVSSGIEISGDIEDDVKAGLTKLFSYKDQYYGELYNPL